MNKLQWFKFSIVDWSMGRIQKCPEDTQKRFLDLCCLYWNKENKLSVEDAEIEIDESHLDILFKKKIVKKNGEFIGINFLDEQLKEITESSKGKSKAANLRWERQRAKEALQKSTDASKNDADALHDNNSVVQKDAEERREEEKREDSINNSVFSNQIKKDQQYIEVTSMQNKINQETVFKYLTIFENHLIQEGKQYELIKDFKAHFRNWLNKQKIMKVVKENNQRYV